MGASRPSRTSAPDGLARPLPQLPPSPRLLGDPTGHIRIINLVTTMLPDSGLPLADKCHPRALRFGGLYCM